MSAPFKYRTLSDADQHYVFVVHDDTPDWWRIVGVFRSKERADGYAEFENMFLDDDDLPAARADELPAPEDLPASPPSKIVAENFQPAPSAQVAAAPAPIAVAPVATKDPKSDGAQPPKTLEAEDGEVDGVWLTAQQRAIYDAIVSAAESGAITPLNSELARLIGHDYDSAACSVSNVLEKKGLIVREGSLGDRIFIVVKTGKRTTARGKWSRVALEKQTAEANITPQDVTDTNGAAKNEPKPQAAPAAAPIVAEPPPFKNGSLPPAPTLVKRSGIARPDTQGGSAPLPPSSSSETSTIEAVVAWLNDMGMTCAACGGGMYLLGDGNYVEASQVIERANRKRRMRKEPEFMVRL